MFPAWLIVPVSPSIAESPRLEDGYPAGGMASIPRPAGYLSTSLQRRIPAHPGPGDPRRFRIAAIGGRLGWFAPGQLGDTGPDPGRGRWGGPALRGAYDWPSGQE